jgi:hypothetical protein
MKWQRYAFSTESVHFIEAINIEYKIDNLKFEISKNEVI